MLNKGWYYKGLTPYTPVRFWYSMLLLITSVIGEIIYNYNFTDVDSTKIIEDIRDIEYRRELILQLTTSPDNQFIIAYDDSPTYKFIHPTFKFVFRLTLYASIAFVIYFVKKFT